MESVQAPNIAAVQCASALGDVATNLAHMDALLRSARERSVRLVVFPELFLTGYDIGDRLAELAEPFHGAMVRAVADRAARNGVAVVCGFPERADGGHYNSAAVVSETGQLVGRHRKVHLFGDEAGTFLRGDRFDVFELSMGRVGVTICYDLEFPEAARCLALGGADLMVVPTANMYPYDVSQAIFARSRAIENHLFVALANTVGRGTSYEFCGGSCIVAPDGSTLAAATPTGEALLCARLSGLGEPPRDQNIAYLAHRQPHAYGPLAPIADAMP